MKTVLVFAAILLSCSQVWGGELNPPAGPTAGTMKTLEDVEPRTAIRQADIPLTISAAGSYYLAENVTSTGNGISINADQVTLDLNGFSITGSGSSSGYGIYLSNQKNIDLRNGTVRNFSYGIYESGSSGRNYNISMIRVVSCGTSGINLSQSDNCVIKNCAILDCGLSPVAGSGNLFAIYVGSNNIIADNTIHTFATWVSSLGYVYGICTGNGCRISGNTLTEIGNRSTVPMVIGIYAPNSCVINDNVVYNIGDYAAEDVYGIDVSNGCSINNNVINFIGTAAKTVGGIRANSTCVISGNSSCSNGESSTVKATGITANSGCTLVDNTVSLIGKTAYDARGIYASASTVKGNNIRSIGYQATGTVLYGLYAINGCLIDNNTSGNNYSGIDILVSSSNVYGTNSPNVGH